VLIALTVATNVFLWTFTQNATYNQAVKESSQMDADLSSERVVAYNTVYSVSPDTVEVMTTMAAQGALSAQIITVWVTWTDVNNITKYGSETVDDINLTPGDTITQTIPVNVLGALDNGGVCNGWLVTARGNLIALEEKKAISTANVSSGIGSIMMDLYNFRYYTYNSSNILNNYPNGTIAFDIPSGEKVAFGVTLTNYDEDNRNINLAASSLFWVTIPTSSVPHSTWWYIVKVSSNGTIAQDYSSITLEYGKPKLLIFASETVQIFNPTPVDNKLVGKQVAVNLLLSGTIGGIPYGQNIPFVSLYFTP